MLPKIHTVVYSSAMSKKDMFPKLEGSQLEGFDPVAVIESLEVIDTKIGQGEEVKKGATISAHYTGALAKTGVIFQSSIDMGRPITFGLDQVIEGWQDGVPGMKVGGTRRIKIPAAMAYGASSPAANIPPHSDLVFDIELKAIR